MLCFPCDSAGKESSCNAEDLGSIPGLGRSPGEGNGNPFHYSCLENPMYRGAWQATVHRFAKSWIQQSNQHPPTHRRASQVVLVVKNPPTNNKSQRGKGKQETFYKYTKLHLTEYFKSDFKKTLEEKENANWIAMVTLLRWI